MILTIIAIFVLAFLLLFIICSCVVAGAAALSEECDIEFTIDNKKIISYHKKK